MKRPTHITLTALSIVCWACIATLAHTQAPLNQPVRINIAEAIIEPFWDPEISGFKDWVIETKDVPGTKIWQNWAAADFQWTGAPEDGVVLRMRKEFNVDLSEYDTLLVKLAAPKGAVLHLSAVTDRGAVTRDIPIEQSEPFEYSMNLAGSQVLASLTVELKTNVEGAGAGWSEWIGLQHSKRLAAYFQRWDFSGMSWEKHIKPADADIDFTPAYGIFLTEERLAELRAEHEAAMRESGTSRFVAQQTAAKSMDFQAGIHEFAESGGRTSGVRSRDVDQPGLPGGTQLAEAGLVLRDPELLAAGAKYALSLAVSKYWDKDFRSHFPGGPADDRAFRRTYTSEDIAEILDMAGNVFTSAGRSYLLRRLAEEGVGPINYVVWRHEYIHTTNQLAYFNKGRMFALLVMERRYPRAKPYTDLALQDTIANIENGILPDGGYAEGPTYFGAMARRNFEIIEHYARARNIEVKTIVPERLRRTADFAEAVASTTTADVIPIGDSGTEMGYNTLEAMVRLMPDSAWLTMLNKRLRLDGREPLPGREPAPRPFVRLPDLGFIASHRTLGGQPLKLLIFGNAARADHAHEDKGHFVLEYGGETFAMDLGTSSYSDPVHQLDKHCQRHNMLVPIGTDERPAPPIQIPVNVTSKGEGDARELHASIDLRPGWERYYSEWTRAWDSSDPSELTITDTYALKKGTGVEFYWQTGLPCEVSGKTVTIRGANGTVRITAPDDCELRIEELPRPDGSPHTRIAITKQGTRGTLRVAVSIQPNP